MKENVLGPRLVELESLAMSETVFREAVIQLRIYHERMYQLKRAKLLERLDEIEKKAVLRLVDRVQSYVHCFGDSATVDAEKVMHRKARVYFEEVKPGLQNILES